MIEPAALGALDLFRDCSNDDLAMIAAGCEELDVEPGEVVVREGRHDHEFYVIVEGVARVTRNGSELARLGAGESFGQTALLTGEPRNATVEACTAMRLLVLAEATFHDLRARRPGFGAIVQHRAAHEVPTADFPR